MFSESKNSLNPKLLSADSDFDLGEHQDKTALSTAKIDLKEQNAETFGKMKPEERESLV